MRCMFREEGIVSIFVLPVSAGPKVEERVGCTIRDEVDCPQAVIIYNLRCQAQNFGQFTHWKKQVTSSYHVLSENS